jgi:hypothetical protein
MGRGRTLWEMLTDWAAGPVEFRYYNPLKARVGHAVDIDIIDWRDKGFFLREIREYKRLISGKKFLFADYVLLARPLGHDDIWLRLRLNPVSDAGRTGDASHHVLLLQLDHECEYNEELHNTVKARTGIFQITENGEVKEEFTRINDVRGSYKATVTIIRDDNQDRRVTSDEIEKRRLEYWDYWREISDDAGQPVTEFLFVEMDTEDGWFEIWRGKEIDPRKVAVL